MSVAVISSCRYTRGGRAVPTAAVRGKPEAEVDRRVVSLFRPRGIK
jgi:hypothetical protein